MSSDLYQVVILAGGLATRLRPITETIPKSLIEINDEPFIQHQLRLLHQHGIRNVVLCIGYLGEQIEKVIGDGKKLGMTIRYSFDGPKLLGTAGAIKQAMPLLEDNFFVLYGDSYLPCSYKNVQTAYEVSHKPALMTVFHNQGKWDTSNVEFSHGRILTYDKVNRTERMHFIDYGLGVFNKQAFERLPVGEAYDMALLYQSLLSQQQLAGYEVMERFYEVGSFTGIDELGYYLSTHENAQ